MLPSDLNAHFWNITPDLTYQVGGGGSNWYSISVEMDLNASAA